MWFSLLKRSAGARSDRPYRRSFRLGVLCGVLLIVRGHVALDETRFADLLVGPLLVADTSGPFDADLARRPGVPYERIHLETTSRSTHENAEHRAPILRALGARRVLVVSDRLHTRRVEGAFEHVGLDVEHASVSVYAGHTGNVSMLVAGTREYAGLLYYRAGGWLAGSAAGPVDAAPAEGAVMQNTSNKPRIVILGASYAGGWDLPGAGRWTVINKGVSGQQSFELLERFDADVAALEPRAVIVWGFINDIFRSDRTKIDATLARARETFSAIVRRARAKGIEPILATEVTVRPPSAWSETLAAWAGALLGKESYQNWVNKHVLETNKWLREMAQRENVLLLDLQAAVSDSSQARQRRFAKDDGSHISPGGYAALTAYALPVLQRHLAAAGGPR